MNLVEILDILRKEKFGKSKKTQDLLEEAQEKIYWALFEDSRLEVNNEIRNNVLQIINDSRCKSLIELENEIDLTSLAEDICDFWGVNFENGPLDDESHWVWEDVNKIVEELGECLNETDNN